MVIGREEIFGPVLCFGDLEAHGEDSVEFYTDKKVVISRLVAGDVRGRGGRRREVRAW